MKILKILLVLVYFLFPFAFLYLYFSDSWYAITDSWSLSMVAGIIAASIMLNQFMISARLKFLDKVFGLDKILKFHGHITILADLLIIFHVIMKLQLFPFYNLQMYLGFAALSIFVLVILITVLLMVKTYTAPVSIFRKMSSSILRKTGIQYQNLRFIHNFTFFAVIILTVHIVLASSTMETNLRIYFVIGWLVLITILYVKNKIIKPVILKKNSLTVAEVKKENENVVTISMNLPEKSKLNYKAGQFAYFRFLDRKPGKEEHPVSFATPIGNSISITLKQIGDWTEKLEHIKEGDKVAVDGPYGIFSYTRMKPDRELLLIAGGIGITPIICMLRDIHKKKIIIKKISFIWQVRKESDLIFMEEIKKFEKDIDNFSFLPVVSKDENWNGVSGRLNQDILNKQGINKKTECFICAPYSMLKNTVKNLKKCGLPKRKIHYEYFNM